MRLPYAGIDLRVRDLDDGGSLAVEVLEEFHDLFCLGRVKISRGLIGKQQSRAMNDRAGNTYQLLLTAGKLVGIEIFLAHDAEAIERVRHHRLAFGTRDIFVGERQIDVFRNVEVIEQVVALENHADVAPCQV